MIHLDETQRLLLDIRETIEQAKASSEPALDRETCIIFAEQVGKLFEDVLNNLDHMSLDG